jgi:hypothetical protein
VSDPVLVADGGQEFFGLAAVDVGAEILAIFGGDR